MSLIARGFTRIRVDTRVLFVWSLMLYTLQHDLRVGVSWIGFSDCHEHLEFSTIAAMEEVHSTMHVRFRSLIPHSPRGLGCVSGFSTINNPKESDQDLSYLFWLILW